MAVDLENVCLRIRCFLEDAVRRNLGQGILLSGGVDTSILAYVASKLGPLRAFTIAIQGAQAPDLEYAMLMSKFLNVKHQIYLFNENDVFETIPIVVKTLRTFDPMEISGGIGIYIGLKLAKDSGVDTVMTGDGGDELFAGYPWLFVLEKEALDSELSKMWEKMTFSSVQLGEAAGVEVKIPFIDPEFKSFAMKLDSRYKVRTEAGQKMGKWILRKAFEDILPKEVVWRNKVFGSIGMGLYAYLPKILDSISAEEFEDKRRKYLELDKVKIQDKERMFYYEIYRSQFGVPHPTDQASKICPNCNSSVPPSSNFCRTCGTYPV